MPSVVDPSTSLRVTVVMPSVAEVSFVFAQDDQQSPVMLSAVDPSASLMVMIVTYNGIRITRQKNTKNVIPKIHFIEHR
jgi:hypothetical protein